eukprot:c10903_g1_i2 orf=335-706(+)
MHTHHDFFVIDHAKPRVDPKVKKKTSLLLCLTINMPFHPGEYGHDGSPQYSHHEPYSLLYLYTGCSPYPNISSTSASPLNATLSNEGITSLLLPLLRGSNICQDRQTQFEEQKTIINNPFDPG